MPAESFNNGNTRIMCKIYSKIIKKTPEWCHCCRSGDSIVNFEQVNAGWVITWCKLQYSNIVKEAIKMNATYSWIHIWFAKHSLR